MPLDAAAGFYQTASLTYRVDAGALQQSLDVLRFEHQQVSYEQVASSPLAGQTIGTLSVAYPHPLGRNDAAQASFTLDSNANSQNNESSASSGWNPLKKKKSATKQPTGINGAQPEVHENWVLDIPKAEADQLFKLLATQGFYQTERAGAVGVQLSAKINGQEVHKNWDQVPELNLLVQRVRRDGTLVSYHRATTKGGGASQIASTRAYSDLLAQVGAPAAAPSSAAVVASPFAMPAQAAVPAMLQPPGGPPMQPPAGMASLPSMTR
jgi:hypothetical protein